jgi:arabinoxylan arabinofuranohydrolase
MGWKYFDFGEDYSSRTMQIRLKVRGTGSRGTLHIHLDSEDGDELGSIPFSEDGGVIGGRIKAVTGKHAIYLVARSGYEGWFAGEMKGRQLLMLDSFVFMK